MACFLQKYQVNIMPMQKKIHKRTGKRALSPSRSDPPSAVQDVPESVSLRRNNPYSNQNPAISSPQQNRIAFV